MALELLFLAALAMVIGVTAFFVLWLLWLRADRTAYQHDILKNCSFMCGSST